jgi:hypothetical protein
VLDRQRFEALAAAETAVWAYAGDHNLHRLHGELGWKRPAEGFNGTPCTDRGFDRIPSLAGAVSLLDQLLPVQA